MALNQEYFDAIHIDVVKKKYYNANKVEAVFADIRREAEALTAENERMRSALSALADRRVELGDTPAPRPSSPRLSAAPPRSKRRPGSSRAPRSSAWSGSSAS